MDPVVLAVVVLALVGSALVFFAFRRRQAARARELLRHAEVSLLDIGRTLASYTSAGGYIPERERRTMDDALSAIAGPTFASVAKILRRVGDRNSLRQVESAIERAQRLGRQLREHNSGYVQREIAAHARLLTEELHLDTAQQESTVRDDERNLVIAGAGSGKTRTLVARTRYLLERGVPPNAILAVTFTNKATEEMEDRLTSMHVAVADRTLEGVTVSTLHALGKRIVQASLAEPISVADDHWTDTLVAAALRDARTGRDPRLAELYLDAVLNFHRNVDERTPAAGGDVTYRTLRGEHVRSLGERIIADFLLVHQVPYQYEAKASWAQVGRDRNAYHPDFTLPEIGACIEYWGVNRAGQVPPGWATSTAAYQQGMAWKRAQFHQAGKKLIEFYDYERTEGALETALRERLLAAGIVLRPLSSDQLEDVLGDMKYIGSAIENLVTQFIANARSLRCAPEEIRKRLANGSPRVRHFGLLGLAVLERYEAALAIEGRIDFSDMLHRAADTLATGANPLPKFQHVLVDEFQDTSAAMARLVKALLTVNGARLFAVGDDWQAIYGFAGGDVDHILHFETHFGPASTTMLDVNYRSPSLIVEAGAALIAHNPNQVAKRVVVDSVLRGEAYVHEVPDDDTELVDRTVRLIQQERQRVRLDEILVLSRTNHLLTPVLDACKRNRIPVANPDRGMAGVRVLSAHKAKGLEAPVVIIVNASDHLLGFPSKVENPDVLEPVRMSAGNEQAEERRLFYVAITRTMQRLHLIARRGMPSPYLAEIEGQAKSPQAVDASRVRTGARFGGYFSVAQLNPLSQRQVAAGIRQAGVLTTATGRFTFTSWSPVLLEQGGTYWIGGVQKDRPYRGTQQVRLDTRTSIEFRSPARSAEARGDTRELRPDPPSWCRPEISSHASQGNGHGGRITT